jgi:hypothetical protein
VFTDVTFVPNYVKIECVVNDAVKRHGLDDTRNLFLHEIRKVASK